MMKEEKIKCGICYGKKYEKDFFISKCGHNGVIDATKI